MNFNLINRCWQVNVNPTEPTLYCVPLLTCCPTHPCYFSYPHLTCERFWITPIDPFINESKFPTLTDIQQPFVLESGLNSITSDDVAAEDTTDPNDESVGKDATEQMEESTGGKDIMEYEQTEEPVVEEDVIVTHLENDNLINSHGANSLCDLNYPAKNLLSCDPDGGQISVDSESLTDSVTCVNHRLPALKLDIENDGVKVKPSELISDLVPKNTFDLNLHPNVVETDMHHIIGDDSQVCIKSFEIRDSRLQVDHSAPSHTDSKPCESQPLVLLDSIS